MEFISDCAESLTPSLTLAVTNKAKEMKARGEQVYGLAGGEPDKDTPENIKKAAIEALNNGATKYTPSVGLPQLRQAISDKLKRDNGLNYTPDQICVCSGAKPAVYTALRATISAGDEVIIPSPYWVSYPSMVELCGGTPVFVETKAENGWKITPEEFENAMTPRTKMIILTTPHNPTGTVYSEDELRALGQIAVDEDILIIADEIYEHLVYGDTKHVS
ncbi:MAG: aminotransferase class I/II-fold pyridoxal phosphate-dependent enzyme, partial [Akkermansia sp.]|nr:aminotransferase class I/II-fold pyridoxal phosphate-dependent enzyme [Akkermansia sp.]